MLTNQYFAYNNFLLFMYLPFQKILLLKSRKFQNYVGQSNIIFLLLKAILYGIVFIII